MKVIYVYFLTTYSTYIQYPISLLQKSMEIKLNICVKESSPHMLLNVTFKFSKKCFSKNKCYTLSNFDRHCIRLIITYILSFVTQSLYKFRVFISQNL